MNTVNLYTDGACSGNPGPGGYCAILQCKGHEKIVSGSENATTNNRMELTAVIEGLKALNCPCEVNVTTDSKYVSDAVNKGWLKSWLKKNWKKADGKPVLNIDLWSEFIELQKIHTLKFFWIKGHDGHPENERCDKIAVSEYEKLI